MNRNVRKGQCQTKPFGSQPHDLKVKY